MCSSLCDDHKRSKRITDNTDATDLFFHGFFILSFRIMCAKAHGFSRIFLRHTTIYQTQMETADGILTDYSQSTRRAESPTAHSPGQHPGFLR